MFSIVFALYSKFYPHGSSYAKILSVNYPSILAYVLGAQKNPLMETVLLSTHNICFG